MSDQPPVATRRAVLVSLLGASALLPSVSGARLDEPSRDRLAPPPTDSPPSNGSKETTTTGRPAHVERRTVVFRQVTFQTFVSSWAFWIEATPPDFEYYLELQYLDRRTEERVEFTAGPMTGRVEDQFDDTTMVLLEAVINVPREGTAAVHLPPGCRPDEGALLDRG